MYKKFAPNSTRDCDDAKVICYKYVFLVENTCEAKKSTQIHNLCFHGKRKVLKLRLTYFGFDEGRCFMLIVAFGQKHCNTVFLKRP